MTDQGLPRAGCRPVADPPDGRLSGRVEDADGLAAEEWSVLIRPRDSKRAYFRRVGLDVLILLSALLVVLLLAR